MIEEIKKSINESATTAKKMAENNVDSVVVGLATKVVITALSGIAAKGFSFINDDIKYKNMIGKKKIIGSQTKTEKKENKIREKFLNLWCEGISR